MNGRSSDWFHTIQWTDAELTTLCINYHEIRMQLIEPSYKRTTLRCHGYIGYAVIGFWDEMIIARAILNETDPFVEACLQQMTQRSGGHWMASGDVARNTGTFCGLHIHFIDGAVLQIAAAHFSVR